METIGRRLAAVRGGTPQAEFAKFFGVSRSTYANYEQGRNYPDANFLFKISQKNGVNLNWLVSGLGDMYLTGDAKNSFNNIYNRGPNGKIKVVNGNHNPIAQVGNGNRIDQGAPPEVTDAAGKYSGVRQPERSTVDVDHIGAIVGAVQSMEEFLKKRGKGIAADKKTAIILLLDQGIVDE